jgi:short-subunit dehydrogenase
MIVKDLHRVWLRRYWRSDGDALAKFAELSPVVVITGGSEGIGFALAKRFAAAGNALLLVSRNAERLKYAAVALRSFGVAVDVLALDLTTADACEVLDQKLMALGAYVDVLVNDAGMGLSGDFTAHPPEAIARLVDLNVRALTVLTRHYLPGMLVRGRGGILNMASVGSYSPGPNQAVYYASKAYVLSLTEAVAHETAGQGVRICALAPGPVKTAFHARMGAERAFYRLLTPPISPDLVARLGHWGFELGMRVVWPGLLTPFAALAMRLMPHRLLNVIVSTLLRPRRH